MGKGAGGAPSHLEARGKLSCAHQAAAWGWTHREMGCLGCGTCLWPGDGVAVTFAAASCFGKPARLKALVPAEGALEGFKRFGGFRA